MKTTALILASLLAYAANAAEVKVLSVQNDVYSLNSVSSEFQINKDMGRAWVETTIDTRSSADDSIGLDTYRGKADALTFDMNSSEIVLDVEGARVVCATVRSVGRGPFRHDKISMTGNCNFKAAKSVVVEDNGYETYRRQVVNVSIVTK
jgi:hypothetical protein